MSGARPSHGGDSTLELYNGRGRLETVRHYYDCIRGEVSAGKVS